MDFDYLQIGNKRVSIAKALKYYKNAPKCQRKLKLNAHEYELLINKLLEYCQIRSGGDHKSCPSPMQSQFQTQGAGDGADGGHDLAQARVLGGYNQPVPSNTSNTNTNNSTNESGGVLPMGSLFGEDEPGSTGVPSGYSNRSYVGLGQEQSILPSNYAPSSTAPQQGPPPTSASQAPQMAMQQGGQVGGAYQYNPNQIANQFEQHQQNQHVFHNQTTANNDCMNTRGNASLLERRFYSGHMQPGNNNPVTGPQPGVCPDPYAGGISNMVNNGGGSVPRAPANFSNINPEQRIQQAYQDQLGNNQIFSRTFDLAQQAMPNIGVERQSMACRRGQSKLA